jgi:hypothetical protein
VKASDEAPMNHRSPLGIVAGRRSYAVIINECVLTPPVQSQ